tara:strand:- start:7744 stop:7986 length:243 start_codon:yes stop_codon:yes gene_type:complete
MHKVETFINGELSTIKLLNAENAIQSVRETLEDPNLTVFNSGVFEEHAEAEALLVSNGVTYTYIYHKLPKNDLICLMERF